MRLFIALNFSDTEKNALIQIQNSIKKESTAGNFTCPDNLHLTLAFLGEIPPERLPPLREILTQCAGTLAPFSLRYDRLGYFPGKGREKLWYLSCKKTPELEALVAHLHDRIKKAGFQLEAREFVPHVTLGRRCISAGAPEFSPIAATFSTMELMLSERIDSVLTYTPIFSAQFRK